MPPRPPSRKVSYSKRIGVRPKRRHERDKRKLKTGKATASPCPASAVNNTNDMKSSDSENRHYVTSVPQDPSAGTSTESPCPTSDEVDINHQISTDSETRHEVSSLSQISVAQSSKVRRVPRRKRFTRIKRRKKTQAGDKTASTISAEVNINDPISSNSMVFYIVNDSELCPSLPPAPQDLSMSNMDIHFHDYCKSHNAIEALNPDLESTTDSTKEPDLIVPKNQKEDQDYDKSHHGNEALTPCTASAVECPSEPDVTVLKKLKEKVDSLLSSNWVSIAEPDGISVLLLSRTRPRVSQRSIFFDYAGKIELHVHNCNLDPKPYVELLALTPPLSEDSLDEFTHRILFVLRKVKSMEICSGVESKQYESVWNLCTAGYVDENLFRESRYFKTFRSFQCHLLLNARSRRCEECRKMKRVLQRKLESSQQESHSSAVELEC